MRSLLQAIREACSPATWSRGVRLARTDSVVGEADEGDEIVLRVNLEGGQVSPQVVLFPDDDDWTCDCNWREDACAHVAAAAIALKQARDAGHKLPGAEQGEPAHVGYRMASHGHKLLMRRVVAHPERDEPIEGSVAQVRQRLGARSFIVTEADLQFEKRFGTVAGGVIARDRVDDVLHALRDVEDLTLDSAKVTVGPPASGLCVYVHDVGHDVRVVLEQDPAIEKVFDNGAMIRGGIVFALGEHGLSVADFQTYREGRIFGPDDLGTVVGEVLPRLRRRLPTRIETDRLPETRTMRPRISVASAREGDAMQVLATIVYGDPAVARVDGERLTLLRRDATAPVRNLAEESKLRRQLRHALDLEPGITRTMPVGEALEFNHRVAALDEVDVTGGAHVQFYEAGPLAPHIEVDRGGSFELWFQPADDTRGPSRGEGSGRADARAVIEAWQSGTELVPLLGGGFGRVPTQWLAQHAARVLALLDAKSERDDATLPTWAVPDLAAVCEALEQPPPPQLDGLRALVDGFEGLTAQTPDDVRATLRDYQTHGVAWLGFLRRAQLGGLLADDMGLGKTLQALCAIEGRTLVVAPTSVLHNWASEIEKFRPGLRADVYHGSGRALDPEADVTLTTYAILRLDIETLADVQWDTAILDEAQAIKNPDSQVARAAYRLPARFRIAMTGTPVENRLEDLWSQLHFANPGLLGGRSDFDDRYVKAISAGDEATAAALRSRIGPFVLRRRKQEVAKELPPRTDVVLHCELGDSERATYDAVRAATQSDVAARFGAGDSMLKILEALLRLRQAACHPGLLPGQKEGAVAEVSSKLELLAERLEIATAAGHKALVFSQWTSLLDLTEPVLERSSLPFVRLDGSTRDRKGVVDAFQDPEGPPVMLISLRAGGTGLNLTAADHVYLLDPWWNPAVEDQAADRAHRIGQERPVLVHRLVARDTVEERILALQARKRALAEAAVREGAAGGITREELLALLD